jgi:hypothetical protein
VLTSLLSSLNHEYEKRFCMSYTPPLLVEKTRAGIAIRFVGYPVGHDLVVIVCGGDRAHIGASALAQPRASLNDAEKISASTSVMCVVGHKEELLAHRIAQTLASRLNCVVSVSCGIHVDNADKQQIQIIQTMVAELLETFVTLCQSSFVSV